MCTTSTAKRGTRKSSRSKTTRGIGRKRAEALLLREIDFIHNPEFERSETEQLALDCTARGERPGDAEQGRRPRRPANVPAYFASLYETPLLTPEQERRAFRRLNFAKYRANLLRQRIDPEAIDLSLVRRIERLLAVAEETRNAITRANLRLVVSVARRFANERETFDDLVGDGNLVLMQAVAKFDYGRGFRFSTYATHALQRTFYRKVGKAHRQRTRYVTGTHERLDETPEELEPDDAGLQAGMIRTILESADETLDEREQYILQARFGFDRHEGPQTLQVVAQALGICKERVRQLQLRAVDKLRLIAEAHGVHPDMDPCTAA